MITMNPYLTLNGRCRAALDFYQGCFGGEVVRLVTFADARMDAPADLAQNVAHAEFRSGDLHFMASDGMPGKPSVVGENIAMALGFTDPAEQTRVFDALAAGGVATMPLQDAPWGDRFGMLTDPFGIRWMLSCSKPD